MTKIFGFRNYILFMGDFTGRPAPFKMRTSARVRYILIWLGSCALASQAGRYHYKTVLNDLHSPALQLQRGSARLIHNLESFIVLRHRRSSLHFVFRVAGSQIALLSPGLLVRIVEQEALA